MTKTTATGYILAALLGAALFISHCADKPNDATQIISIKEIHDTTTYAIKGDSIPSPERIIHDTIPADVDTAAILADYYSHKEYDRSFNDSNILISIQDTVSQNALGRSTINYKWKKPVQIINTLAPVTKKSMVFIGADLSTTSGLGISAAYLNKNILYSGGYFIGDKSIQVGAKIGFSVK